MGSESSAGKIMATIFWDSEGVIMFDFVQKGCTANLLRKLKDTTAQKDQKFVPRSPHPSRQCSSTQSDLNRGDFGRMPVRAVPHPPYSPDLAQSDFFLFPEMKKHLRGRHFQTDEAVINEVVQWCESQLVSFFLKASGTWHR
jgi:histone-lysine N-methyltransferase SETMAR